ncbi:AI-2E family transporter [Acidisoma cellulosilytica]|uniref:AI-2E family transporter n=1 Tax=Acidisoma cellulosilyticum TaxID=2802395 RepID=A0A963YXU0_9PROT|nr:AI-2E family transporter [Acidisoma cellulosilyticum]MCB8879217.1 AI-2E family transporter [Acidisoma cellulosilyticum]
MTDLPPPASPLPEQRERTARNHRIALAIGLILLLVLFFYLFSAILLPFVAALGIAYFLDPVATRMARAGAPRWLAAVLLVLALITGGLTFVLLLYPIILSQIGLLLQRVPEYVVEVQAWANGTLSHLQKHLGADFVDSKIREIVATHAGAMIPFAVGALSRVIGGGFAIVNALTLIVVTPIAAFYLLRDWPRLVAKADALLPLRYAGIIRLQVLEVDRILSAWLRGQLLCCLMLAAFYSLGLTIVGLDLGLIVGMTAGLLSFIPYVGTITGAVTSIGLAVAQFPNWNGVFLVIAVFVLGQILEGYVIYPRLLGNRVELHDVLVIFALLAGGAAFGFLGVLLAVPVTAALGVLARFWIRRYLHSPLYLDPPPGDDRLKP